MGRKSTTGGVTPLGHHRIQFDFTIDGQRYRPTLPWIPHEANLQRARGLLIRIKARIAAGSFVFTEEFPQFRGRNELRLPFSARTCGDVSPALIETERRSPKTDASCFATARDRYWSVNCGCASSSNERDASTTSTCSFTRTVTRSSAYIRFIITGTAPSSAWRSAIAGPTPRAIPL
jgi:Arm DNA-binding domain